MAGTHRELDLSAAAQDLGELGFRVFPCKPRQKVPRISQWPLRATKDASAIRRFWEACPTANIGIATGRGLFVVDSDSELAEEALVDLDLPPTPTVLTARGRHRYFHGSCRTRNLLPGVDVRGVGGLVLGAGSVHPNGRTYRWETSPHELTVAKAPPQLLRLTRARPHVGPAKRSSAIPEGARNSTLARVAGSLRRAGLGPEAIRAALMAENAARCAPPLPASETEGIALKAANWPAPPPWFTDILGFSADPLLNCHARHLLILLSLHADADGHCHPGRERLAAAMGVSKPIVSKAVKELVAAGRITARRRQRRTTLYVLNPTSPT